MVYEFQKKVAPVFRWIWEKYVNLFHPHIRPIVPRATGVAALIWVWIYMILFFANFWPQGKQCAWKFPKIFSCLLTTHETLAAGLIGAGVAVWAAWLAWIALQQQIEGKQDELPPAAQQAKPRTPEELARLVVAGTTSKARRRPRKRKRVTDV
jgi:hypothetical protein